jgi:hypothetical protein
LIPDGLSRPLRVRALTRPPPVLAGPDHHQPFTPVTDALRRLLLGNPVGHSAIAAVAWGAGITLLSCLWAIRRFNRDPVRWAIGTFSPWT